MSPKDPIKATIKSKATAVIIALIASTSEETQGGSGAAVGEGVLQKTFRQYDILDKTHPQSPIPNPGILNAEREAAPQDGRASVPNA